MLTSTYTAHVVNPYTNASGKQLAAAQHNRSQRSAHARGRRFGHEGEVGGEEARVAMVDGYTTREGWMFIGWRR